MPLLSVLLLCLCLTNFCHAHDYTVPYDNIPISAKTWEQINIKWHGGYAELLRPITYAHRYHLVDGNQIYLNLTEFGIPKEKILITCIIRVAPRYV